MKRDRDSEIARYLSTGEHDDPLFTSWPGENMFERARLGSQKLREALATSVARRTSRCAASQGIDAEAAEKIRPRLHAMVHGLVPRAARDRALDLLLRSVVFVNSTTITTLLLETSSLSLTWKLANVFLVSVGAEPLGRSGREPVGISSDKVAFVSLRYFTESGPFDDFVVHECAHVLHDTKLRDVGIPTRGREWLLEIDYRKRETFAYACEHYGAITARGRTRKEHRALLDEHLSSGAPPDERVDEHEYVDIMREAVVARNGWSRILVRCSQP